MVYSLSYRRPERVARPSSAASINGEVKQASITDSVRSSTSSTMSHGIPEALSFDRIIAGGTCPPCTTRDFMNYLKYVELAAENLQFYLWFRSYTKRFADLPDHERALSPVWAKDRDADGPAARSNIKGTVSDTAMLFKGTAFATDAVVAAPALEKQPSNPFHTPPRTPNKDFDPDQASLYSYEASMTSRSRLDHAARAADAFDGAGLKWKPLTVQPYREEITRIISIYIADSSPRQLNLSSKERINLLHALQNTTHPSAFRDVMVTIEWSLRCQAHPNFIRWTICNGNRPRVIFARGLGTAGIVLGLTADILITLSSAGRGWRVLSFIGFFIGISTLIAAWKGMCVVLHGMHHRHLRPWELFTSDGEQAPAHELDPKSDSYDSLVSHATSNSFEDEPWVAKYDHRNLVRKVFDREIWIQEPALRQIQDTIFLQAVLAALLLSGIAVGIFCALPHGNMY